MRGIITIALLIWATGAQAQFGWWFVTGQEESTEVQNPNDLTGVLVWLEGDADVFEATSDIAEQGDTVQIWGDQTSNGNDADYETTNPPTYDAASTFLNLNENVVFSGGGLRIAASAFNFGAGDPFTVIMIRNSTENTSARFAGGENPNAVIALSEDQVAMQGPGGTISHDSTNYFDEPQLFYFIFDGANSKIFVNGVEKASGNIGSHSVSSWFYIGDWVTAAGNDGELFLFVVCDGVVPENERSELRTNYISSKYGL